jgi:hypothetical protein
MKRIIFHSLIIPAFITAIIGLHFLLLPNFIPNQLYQISLTAIFLILAITGLPIMRTNKMHLLKSGHHHGIACWIVLIIAWAVIFLGQSQPYASILLTPCGLAIGFMFLVLHQMRRPDKQHWKLLGDRLVVPGAKYLPNPFTVTAEPRLLPRKFEVKAKSFGITTQDNCSRVVTVKAMMSIDEEFYRTQGHQIGVLDLFRFRIFAAGLIHIQVREKAKTLTLGDLTEALTRGAGLGDCHGRYNDIIPITWDGKGELIVHEWRIKVIDATQPGIFESAEIATPASDPATA